MRKFVLILAVLSIALVGYAVAQEETPVFDPAKVDAILLFGVGIGGLTVTGITEMLKRLLKAQGAAAYAISALVSFGATAVFLMTQGSFSIVNLAIYGIAVFLTSNGIYKFTAKTPT